MLAALLGFTSCKKHNNDIVYNRKYIDEIKKARKEFSIYLASNSIPGASIAVSKGGEIIYSEGMGLASKDLEVRATRQTKFRIGLVTELFTSLAYQLLVEEGTLEPDSSVWHYLPGFPEKKYKITLEDLVNNTSGIGPGNSPKKYQAKFNIDIQKGLDVFKNDTLIAEPGYYQYMSPHNYSLLGAVMEKATNKKFADIVQELVIDSLHLENTVFDHPLKTIKGRSDFFDHNIVSFIINAIPVDLRSQAPSSGLLSNAEDLVRFGNALLYPGYVHEDVRDRIFTLFELKYGDQAQNTNGWFILKDTYGRKIYARSGHVVGGGASILVFPEEELIVAIAMNTTMELRDPPDYKIATYFLPEPETQERPATEKKGSSAAAE